ncbi:MAG: hypothetical protein WDZ51_06685 [Pirellulaceae bacterium]
MPSITTGVHAYGAYCLKKGLAQQLRQLQTELAVATDPDCKLQLELEINQVKLRQRELRRWFDWCLF